ncbi:MAG: TonB-dependent receptor [Candidatus Solibacter sp.]|nr:TonB-dependent receptor [Candidatus Solibacter sp.]
MKRSTLFVMVCLLSVAGIASAQLGTEGSIRGVITDEQGGAMPGVNVSATSPSAPGNHVAVTESDGTYRLLNLAPGVFEIVAERQGFSKSVRTGIEVRAGLNLNLDIELKTGAVQSTVTVTGEAPLLETEKPIQAVNVSGDFQRALPLSTRHDLTDALEVAPGVAARTFISNNGTQVYMLRGTDVEQHVILIDGADMSSARQSRTDTVNFATSSVSDSQVKTGGADATAPAGLGVLLNVATKSGTDQIHGTAEVSYQARAWNGNNDPKGVPTISDGVQPEFSIGGPIKKGRAWFFASYKYNYRNTQISRSAAQLANLHSVQADWQPFDNHSRTPSLFLKGSLQLTPKHQMSGFYLRMSGYEEEAPSLKPFSAGGVSGFGASTRVFSTWTNTLTSSFAVSYNSFAGNNSVDSYSNVNYGGPQINLYTGTNPSSGKLVGTGFILTTGNNTNFPVSPTTKTTIQGDVNWYKSGWVGSHEIQAGIFLQPHMNLQTNSNYANGGFIVEDQALKNPVDPNSGFISFHRQYIDPSQLSTRTADTTNRDYAGYIQDSWKPIRQLTIVGGLRLDKVIALDNLFNVQTQSSMELQPRVGATYRLTKDGRNVVHGTFSRISAKPEANSVPNLGGSVTVNITDKYDTAKNGTFSTVLVTPGATKLSAAKSIDPNRHQAHVEEYLAGFRRQFAGQISMDATFVRRYYQDMPDTLDVNGIYQNGKFLGYKDPTQNAILMATNNIWNTPAYTGLEFTASKRSSKSQFLVGYTRAFQHMNGQFQPDDPAGFIQPDTFANDKGIGSTRGISDGANSYTNTQTTTRNPMWIKHTMRIAGSYFAPWGIFISSNLNILSGPYSGPIIQLLSAPDPAFGPALITLPNGRVVSNPLATTVRFAYANRGQGQVQAPLLATWNARVAKTFTLAETRRLQVGFSVNNITNRGAQQEFCGGSATTACSGSNQLGSPNFAYAPDGTFQGQNRQAARAGQLTVRFDF